jgi:hypothetical protein
MRFSSFKQLVNPDRKPYSLIGFGDNRQSDEDYFGIPELYLRICWIEEANTSLIFITLDTLYFNNKLTSDWASFINKKYNINTDQIIFNASHTHSAPNISMPSWAELNHEYIDKIKAAFYKGIEYCANHLDVGYIVCEEIVPQEKIFISRRKKTIYFPHFWKKKVERLPNHNSPTDQNIRLIKIYNRGKVLDTVLYNFSCHPVFNRNDNFSSDFIGDISKKLEQHISNAMFLQGFCGDIRANYTGKLSLSALQKILTHGISLKQKISLTIKLFFYHEIFTPYTKAYYNIFTNSIYTLIKNKFDKYSDQTSENRLHIKNYSFTHTLYSDTHKSYKRFRTSLLTFGKTVLISIPAEVNTHYSLLIKKAIKNNLFLPLGYGSDMICYLPGADEIKDGGYEVNSFKQYDLDSRLSVKTVNEYESILEISIKEIVKEIDGRN